MADKYLIHGATYCGDGTSSAEAASNGAVGAWNNINVLEGTAPAYGTLAAGDVVHIRSKTSAGADITRTLAANVYLGLAAATEANPVQWILDGGTVWSGISGTLTYTATTNVYSIVRNYNDLRCEVKDCWVFSNTGTPNGWQMARVGLCVIENVLYDTSTSTYANGMTLGLTDVYATFISCHFKLGSRYNTFFSLQNFSGMFLIDPDFELVYTQATPLIAAGYANIKIIGGVVRGSGATTTVPIFYAVITCGAFICNGLKFPNSMLVADQQKINGAGEIFVNGADGSVGAFVQGNWGNADSRGYNNYPYLDARLPDSASTGWSWKLYSLATHVRPMSFALVNKLYTGDPATLAVTINFLIATTLSLNKKTLWFDLYYIEDSNGLRRKVSSYDSAAAAHDASTAAWSALTYGAVSFDRFKYGVTLPSNIKKDTSVVVVVRGTYAAASANDLVILDPSIAGV